MNLLQTTMLSAIASGLLVLGLGASPAARATIDVDLSPSGACMASSGPGADNFYFSPLVAQNTAGVSHYIVCNLPMVRRAFAEDATSVVVHFVNPFSTTRTVNCVLAASHTGSAVGGNFAFSFNVAANSAHSFYTVGSTDIPAVSDSALMALSCLIPAGVSMGSINVTMPGSIPV